MVLNVRFKLDSEPILSGVALRHSRTAVATSDRSGGAHSQSRTPTKHTAATQSAAAVQGAAAAAAVRGKAAAAHSKMSAVIVSR